MSVLREEWQEKMRRALRLPTDRLVFNVYFIRFEQTGNSGTVHRFLVKRRGEAAPCRMTIYRSIRRLERMAADYRNQ